LAWALAWVLAWALAWTLALALVAELPPASLERNHKVISSVHPSVFNTSLAGIPLLLQLTHAMYWLCEPGGEREPV